MHCQAQVKLHGKNSLMRHGRDMKALSSKVLSARSPFRAVHSRKKQGALDWENPVPALDCFFIDI
jgi:hypothetical protein